jgi:hypothetical protein
MRAKGVPMALEGGADLRAVSLRLRATGQVGLKRAMFRNIRLATAPAAARVRQSALSTLPKDGAPERVGGVSRSSKRRSPRACARLV